MPVAALDGQEVVTAEGLGTPDALHPVQREMAVRGGSQCGYCTPGFVCSMAAEYYRADRTAPARDAEPAPRRARTTPHERGPNGFDLHALSGNLCRCTGYRPIRDAAYALGEPRRRRPVCRAAGRPRRRPAASTRLTGADRHLRPPRRPGRGARPARRAPRRRPRRRLDRLGRRGQPPRRRARRSPSASTGCPSCATLDVGDDVVEIGAALTLIEVERGLAGRIPLLDEVFPQFASRLIRNGATIGGNLGTGSPIGDTPPALLALEAVVVLASADGDREVPLADYFTGYRQTVKRPGELIRAVRIPLPLSGITAFHKIAKRRFDDISSVAVGFALDLQDGVVAKARIGLGGVAATPIRALATEAALEGRPWTRRGRRARRPR